MFKVGDIVRCKPGFTRAESSGGMGYVEGKEFVIDHITRFNTVDGGDILWPSQHDCGIYARSCELVTTKAWTGSVLKFNFV